MSRLCLLRCIDRGRQDNIGMGDRVDDTASVVYWICASYSHFRFDQIVLLIVSKTQIARFLRVTRDLEILEDIFTD